MYNVDSSFPIDSDGLLFEEGVWLTSGSASPVGLFTPLVPTRYYRSNGDEWYHLGSGSWIQISTSTAFDEDKILTSQSYEVLISMNGNVLRGN